MSKAKSSKKPKSTNRNTNIASLRLILGGYLVVFLLAQLFTFEKFPSMIESIGLGDWSTLVLPVFFFFLNNCSAISDRTKATSKFGVC